MAISLFPGENVCKNNEKILLPAVSLLKLQNVRELPESTRSTSKLNLFLLARDIMPRCNTANGGLFVACDCPNTVRLLWTLYVLHSFNPQTNTANIRGRRYALKRQFLVVLQSIRIIQSVSDSDSCKIL